VSAPGERVSRSWVRVAAVAGRRAAHLWGVVLIVVVWQAWVSVHHYNVIVMPPPAAVVSELLHNPGVYASHLAFTLILALLGLALGMALGIVLAVLVWASPLLSGVSAPMALLLQAVPVVALIPVIARLLGYNDLTELAITSVVCFFPAFVFAGSGLRRPPPGSADVLAVLGASRFRRLRMLLLPGSVPDLLVALRISAPLSVLAALLGEFLMGTNGLGYFIALATSELQTVSSWAAAILATIASVAFFRAASRLEALGLARWT